MNEYLKENLCSIYMKPQRMQEVITLVKKRNLPIKVLVGGAVITPEYAKEIGADGYASDAANAVRVAKELLM